MDNNIPIMLTITETAKRTGLSYNNIRQLCITNKVVYVKAGTKFLLNFNKFIDFLNGESVIK